MLLIPKLKNLLFARNDGFAGTNACASAAVNACIGIDVIDVAFADSADGTFRETCAASDADVCDYVSHSSSDFVFVDLVNCFVSAKLRLFLILTRCFAKKLQAERARQCISGSFVLSDIRFFKPISML